MLITMPELFLIFWAHRASNWRTKIPTSVKRKWATIHCSVWAKVSQRPRTESKCYITISIPCLFWLEQGPPKWVVHPLLGIFHNPCQMTKRIKMSSFLTLKSLARFTGLKKFKMWSKNMLKHRYKTTNIYIFYFLLSKRIADKKYSFKHNCPYPATKCWSIHTSLRLRVTDPNSISFAPL